MAMPPKATAKPPINALPLIRIENGYYQPAHVFTTKKTQCKPGRSASAAPDPSGIGISNFKSQFLMQPQPRTRSTPARPPIVDNQSLHLRLTPLPRQLRDRL